MEEEDSDGPLDAGEYEGPEASAILIVDGGVGIVERSMRGVDMVVRIIFTVMLLCYRGGVLYLNVSM